MTRERRSFGRFGTALKAYYIINGDQADKKHDCLVINMSRKGFGLHIKADEKINKDSTVCLEIYVPEKKTPALVKGIVRWVEKRGNAWTAGIESQKIIDELEFSKLS